MLCTIQDNGKKLVPTVMDVVYLLRYFSGKLYVLPGLIAADYVRPNNFVGHIVIQAGVKAMEEYEYEQRRKTQIPVYVR